MMNLFRKIKRVKEPKAKTSTLVINSESIAVGNNSIVSVGNGNSIVIKKSKEETNVQIRNRNQR